MPFMKVNVAMGIVSVFIIIIGLIVVVSVSLPMQLRYMGGGFLAAGVLMLLTNVVIGILIRKFI